MSAAEYLRLPYCRVVVPDTDGSFRAEIREFPGCIALGDTAAEALSRLEEVAASWLEATIAKGQRVPEPTENATYSGKLVVRLPKSLHKKAAQQAALEGVSLNQFIVGCIAEQVGARASSSLRPASFLFYQNLPTGLAQLPSQSTPVDPWPPTNVIGGECMPEANQFTVTNKELLEILIKQAGVHEGRWILMANFGFSAGNFGPSPNQVAPGAVTVINHLGIQRAQKDTPEEMSLDAALVNPAPGSHARRLSGRGSDQPRKKKE